MAGELILRAKKAADNACIAAELASLRTAMNASFARTDRRRAVLDARTTAARAYTVRYLLDDERERRRQLKLAAVQGKLTPRDDLLRAEQRERGAAASLALHAGERAAWRQRDQQRHATAKAESDAWAARRAREKELTMRALDALGARRPSTAAAPAPKRAAPAAAIASPRRVASEPGGMLRRPELLAKVVVDGEGGGAGGAAAAPGGVGGAPRTARPSSARPSRGGDGGGGGATPRRPASARPARPDETGLVRFADGSAPVRAPPTHRPSSAAVLRARPQSAAEERVAAALVEGGRAPPPRAARPASAFTYREFLSR